MKMKQRLRGFYKNPEFLSQVGLLALLLVSCCIMFRSYLFGEEMMVFDDIGSDTWQQYTMHYASIINHLRSGTFSFWDFTNGLGTSMFSLNMFDPTLILLYGIGVILGPAHMMIYISWVQVLRILAAGYVFYRYLKKFPFSRQARFAGAYIYGLNGYLLVWGQHYQFGIVTIYLPLLLLFAEKLLRREKGRGLFPAAVFLCACDSVYFSYMTLAAVGFYLLFRVWMMDGWNVKERMGRFLAGCGQILFGVGMSAAAFLPTVNVLLGVSSRISGEGNGILGWIKNFFSLYGGEYYRMLKMRFFSSHLENASFLMDGEGTAWNYYEAPVLFCGTLTLFLCVQFLAVFWRSNASKRVKAAVYSAAVLMVLCVLMPWGGTMFNAFVAPSHRYTFVLMPFFVLSGVWMWDYLYQQRRISRICLLITEVLLLLITYEGYGYSVLKVYRINAVVLAVTGSVMVLGIEAAVRLKKEKLRRAAVAILAVAAAVNVLSEGGTGYSSRVTMRKMDTPAEEMEEQAAEHKTYVQTYGDRKVREALDRPQDYFRTMYFPEMEEIKSYLKELDPEFYRMEKDYRGGTVAMDSLAQGYRGISTYNSVINGNVKEFVDTCYPELHYPDKNHYVFWKNAEDNQMAAFFGVRYLISREPDLDSSKYRLLGQFGEIYLYQNVLEADTARFYETAISEESLGKLCIKENRQELLFGAIAIEDGTDIQDVKELPDLQKETGGASGEESSVVLDAPEKDSRITGRIRAGTDGYVLFLIPYEKGWSLTLNGEEKELIRGDLGFLACSVEEGVYEIELTFRPPLLREGVIVSIFFWVIYLCRQTIAYRKRKQGSAA